jgi:parallel beta-helix repeat protein
LAVFRFVVLVVVAAVLVPARWAVAAPARSVAAAAVSSSYQAVDLGVMAGGPSNGAPVAISPNGQWVLVATASAQADTFDHDVLYSTASGKSVALPAGTTIQPDVCPNNRAGQFTGYAVDNSGRAWGTWSETQTTGATTSCLTVPGSATGSGGGPLTGTSFTTASLGTCSYPTSDESDGYGLSGQMVLSSGDGIVVGQALADCPNPPPPIGPGPIDVETFVESDSGGSFSEVWNQLEQPNPGYLAGINDSGTILAGPEEGTAGGYEWKGNATPADVLPGYDLLDSTGPSEINDQGNLLVYNGSSNGLYQPATRSFTAISGGAVSLNNHNEVVAEGGPVNPPSVWTPQSGSESVSVINAAAVGMTGTFLPSAVADNGDLVGTAQSGGGAWHDYLLTPGGWVVNSTGLQDDTATALANGACDVNLTGPPACTLRAAIEVADQDEGGSITFDIPAGHGNTFDGTVPQIKDPKGTGMPAVGSAAATSGISIDGTTQPGTGKIELSGTSGDNSDPPKPTAGLTLAAAGSTVRGLVINGYSDGIDVQAASTIQGDWLRTNAGGTAADPNPLGTNTSPGQLAAQIGIDLSSSGSQIGGSATGQGDVFATGRTSGTSGQFRPSAALVDTSGGNVIQGNSVGVVPGTQTALVDPAKGALFVTTAAVDITGADTVGGATAGAGNALAPASTVAGASAVQGNTFLGELGASGPVQIGGATTTPGTGRGNVFMPTLYGSGSDRELEITADRNGDPAVQGNRFAPTGAPAIVAGAGVLIGGKASDRGNLVQEAATDPPGTGGLPGVDGAITLHGDGNTIENNVLANNGGWGAVQVQDGDGNTITRNTMSGNPHGIEFGTFGYIYDTDVTKTQSGPNDLEYYPILFSTSSTPAGTTVSGRIEQPGTFAIDLYSQTHCGLQAEAEGQGEDYLGSTTVSSTPGGEDFSFTAAPAPSGQDAITATATASNGSTSEFSPCLITNSHAPTLLGYGVRPPTSTVPITVTAAAAPRTAAATGKGTLWLLCPALTTGSCTGTAALKTTGTSPVTITKQHFTMAAGSAAKITVTLTGALLTQLESAHKLAVKITTTAKDAATPPGSQTHHQALTLTYP